MKGLSECKASESNIRCIRVKDIIKEVEDYLKTYSSAGMDISWRETQYLLKARQKVMCVVCTKYEVGKSSEQLTKLFTKV
ncbi:hypothetical protein Tco_0697992 [Tanacetum coccineum]